MICVYVTIERILGRVSRVKTSYWLFGFIPIYLHVRDEGIRYA